MISTYRVLADRRDSGEKELRKMTAPGEAVSLIVQNLRPGTRYMFKVFAENRHGLGVESQTITARTTDEGWLIELRLDCLNTCYVPFCAYVCSTRFSAEKRRSDSAQFHVPGDFLGCTAFLPLELRATQLQNWIQVSSAYGFHQHNYFTAIFPIFILF